MGNIHSHKDKDIEDKYPTRCTICGKNSFNCKIKRSTVGALVYAVCPSCLVASEHEQAKEARADASRKEKTNGKPIKKTKA